MSTAGDATQQKTLFAQMLHAHRLRGQLGLLPFGSATNNDRPLRSHVTMRVDCREVWRRYRSDLPSAPSAPPHTPPRLSDDQTRGLGLPQGVFRGAGGDSVSSAEEVRAVARLVAHFEPGFRDLFPDTEWRTADPDATHAGGLPAFRVGHTPYAVAALPHGLVSSAAHRLWKQKREVLHDPRARSGRPTLSASTLSGFQVSGFQQVAEVQGVLSVLLLGPSPRRRLDPYRSGDEVWGSAADYAQLRSQVAQAREQGARSYLDRPAWLLEIAGEPRAGRLVAPVRSG